MVEPSRTTDYLSANPVMRVCADTCDATGVFTTVTLADDSALPAWITWSASTSLVIAPTDGTALANSPYTLKYVYTPVDGFLVDGSSLPTYSGLTLTVTCDVTSFTTGNTPSTQAYNIFDDLKMIPLTGVTFTQDPACGYTYTLAYTYASSPAVSFAAGGTAVVPSVEIASYAGADASNTPLTMTMSTTITMDGGQQSVTSIAAPDVSFQITLTNPCVTTAIDDISFTPSTISVTDGGTGTATFSIPQDAVDQAKTIQDYCGEKVYTIKDSSANTITTWASIAADPSTDRQYILTIDSNQYTYFASAVSETLTVETTFSAWAGNAGNTNSNVIVSFTPVNCDCSYMAWTAPAVITQTVTIDASITPSINDPASDDSATATETSFSNCYENAGNCPTTGSYAALSDFEYRELGAASYIAAPAWITFSAGSIIVAPTDPALVGVYEIAATYSPASGTASQFMVLTLTV